MEVGTISKAVDQMVKPHLNFLESNYFEILEKICGVKFSYDNPYSVPVINNKSLFWSTEVYKGIKNQYFIGDPAPHGYPGLEHIRNYHYKLPLESEEKLLKSYATNFRRNLKKSLKEPFTYDLLLGKNIDQNLRKRLYEIFCVTMKRINTFLLPWELFNALFDLEGVEVKALVVWYEGDLAAVQLVVGNVMYLSGADLKYLGKRVNNYLFHKIFLEFSDDVVFVGTGFVGSGTDRFKKQCGTEILPCYYLPDNKKFLSAKKIDGFTQHKYIPFYSLSKLVMKRKKNIIKFLPFA